MNGEKAGARKITANNILRQICPRVNRFFAGTDFKMQLRRIYAAGAAYRCNFFPAQHFLPFFDIQTLIVGIRGDIAIAVFYQNEIAKPFQLVAGIGNDPFVCRFYVSSGGCLDVYSVVAAPFADNAEI